MTDQEIVDAPEVQTIRRHLKAAAVAMKALQDRSGRRRLKIFVEGESGPCIQDGDRDERVDHHIGSRLVPLTEGGPYLNLRLGPSSVWGCGAW